jgi:putative hydrolase of the HAD superfamily
VTAAGDGKGPALDGVLFDYGETLAGFSRPDEALANAEERILRLLDTSNRTAPSRATLHAILDRVEREVLEHQETGALEEIDVIAVSLRAYEEAGAPLDSDILDEALRIEQEAWWHGVRLDPDAIPLLDALRAHGLRLGLCSNAPYRVQSLHAQLAFLGLDAHLDAVTFSSEVGWRKPSPRIFAAALSALGTTPERTVMVGDSETADIAGAQAAGMRAVLIRRSGNRTSGDADEVIAALQELPGALRNMGLYLG